MALSFPFFNPSTALVPGGMGSNPLSNFGPLASFMGGRTLNYLHVDVLESNDSYTLIIDAPGANKSNLKIEAWNEHLTGLIYVCYNREEEESGGPSTEGFDRGTSSTTSSIGGQGSEQERGTVLFSEKPVGKVFRTVKLHEPINIDNVQAKIENGCLTITVLKKDPSQFNKRKRLPINATTESH